MRYLWNPNLTRSVNIFLLIKNLILGTGFIVLFHFVTKGPTCAEEEQSIKQKSYRFKVQNKEEVPRGYNIEGIKNGIKVSIGVSYYLSGGFGDMIKVGDSIIKERNSVNTILVKRSTSHIYEESCKGYKNIYNRLNPTPYNATLLNIDSLNPDLDLDILAWKKDTNGKVNREISDGHLLFERYNLIGKDTNLTQAILGKPNLTEKSNIGIVYCYYVVYKEKRALENLHFKPCFVVSFDTKGLCKLNYSRF